MIIQKCRGNEDAGFVRTPICVEQYLFWVGTPSLSHLSSLSVHGAVPFNHDYSSSIYRCLGRGFQGFCTWGFPKYGYPQCSSIFDGDFP